MMKPNLKAEMARTNISYVDIASLLGVCEKTARNKLNGSTKFTIEEALKIKSNFFSNCSSDYLFASDTDKTERSRSHNMNTSR